MPQPELSLFLGTQVKKDNRLDMKGDIPATPTRSGVGAHLSVPAYTFSYNTLGLKLEHPRRTNSSRIQRMWCPNRRLSRTTDRFFFPLAAEQ